jgi:hypothetical protein
MTTPEQAQPSPGRGDTDTPSDEPIPTGDPAALDPEPTGDPVDPAVATSIPDPGQTGRGEPGRGES